ncbi:MAG: autotransporter domain-containing protein [Deltaproteobacteria bacterium]|nr:autotransporter domain-containing protein [Deltaproteobacteria bacterium]
MIAKKIFTCVIAIPIKVDFSGGQADSVVGGYGSINTIGNVTGSVVNVTGGTILNANSPAVWRFVLTPGSVTGGYLGENSTGNITDNEVYYTNATADRVIGGLANTTNSTGDVLGNRVEIYGQNAVINDYVAGGISNQGNASYNEVRIANGTVGGSSIRSHYSVSNNTVAVSGGFVTDAVGGLVNNSYLGTATASILNATVKENTVAVTGGQIGNRSVNTDSGLVAGGAILANNNGTVTQNTVNFQGGYAKNVRGGSAGDNTTANVTQNIVYVSGGEIGNSTVSQTLGHVAGGWAGENASGNINLNEVHFSGGFAYYVKGGDAGDNYSGNVTGNKVIITGGAITNLSAADPADAGEIAGGRVGGNSTGASVSSNEVYFSEAAAKQIFGGYAGDNSANNVTSNKVTIYSGDINGNVTGGRSSLGLADNNTVAIANATSIANVFGGYSVNSSASFNEIILEDIIIKENVFGGYSDNTSELNNNNTVTLQGANIGGDVIGGTNVSSANNKIIFRSGQNTVNGSIRNEGGNLSIAGGANRINQSVTVLNADIAGGQTAFAGLLNTTTGNLTVTGGANLFTSVITTDSTIGGTSVNTYNGSTYQAASLGFDGGTHNFDNAVSIDTASPVTAAASIFNLDGAALTFNQMLAADSSSRINVGANSMIASPSVFMGGTAALRVNTLTINGNLGLTDGSTLIIGNDGTDQGLLVITGAASLSDPDDVIQINPNNFVFLDSDKSIIDAASGLNLFTEDNFESAFYSFIHDSGSIFPELKSIEDIAGEVADEYGLHPTRNDRRIVSLMDRVTDDYLNSGDQDLIDAADHFYTVVGDVIDLAAQAENRGGDGGAVIETFLRQISGESIVSVYPAVLDSALKAQGVVFRRLDRIHEAATAVPPSAGTTDTFNRVWVGGFGSWARQKNRGSHFGYDYNHGGFSLGYDRRAESVPGLRFGIATAFSFGKIESKNNWAEVDVNTAGVGLYGSYMLDSGLFFDASLSYGHSENDSTIDVLGGGRKKGSFDINTWQLGARVGYVFDSGSVKLTPTVGLRYVNIRQDSWAERVTGNAAFTLANTFEKKRDNIFEIPVLLKLNTAIESGQTRIIPELRLGYTFVAKRPDSELNAGFAGAPGYRVTIDGVRPSRGSFQAGAGVKFEVTDQVDIFVNYDLDASRSFVNHNAAAGIGFNF